jgi:hypothetical protein
MTKTWHFMTNLKNAMFLCYNEAKRLQFYLLAIRRGSMYLCYTSEKVDAMVSEVCCHMQDWGIPLTNICETGYQEMLRESSYYELYERIEKESYAVIIMTKQLLQDVNALIELEILKRRFQQQKVKVFTFMNTVEELQIPQRFCWLKDTAIMVINGKEDIHRSACRIVSMVLQDEAEGKESEYLPNRMQNREGQVESIVKSNTLHKPVDLVYILTIC